jgi:hypothetical protein
MSKSSSKKAQTVYAMTLYGGVIKSGYCYVQLTTSHPETEFEKLRPYYGKDVKGRWVKSTKSQESLEETLKEKLSEHEYSDLFYKLSTTDVVKVLKEVFSCNKCTTMGIYQDKEDNDDKEDEEVAPPAPKVAEKKVASKVAESKEEPKTKGKEAKVETKKVEDKSSKAKATKKAVVSDDEEDTKKKVVKSKSSTKTQIVLSDSEEELEEEE